MNLLDTLKKALEALELDTHHPAMRRTSKAVANLRTAIAELEKAEPSHNDHPSRHWDRTCPACNPAPAVPEELNLLRTQVRELRHAQGKFIQYLERECGDRCNAEYNPCSARLAKPDIRSTERNSMKLDQLEAQADMLYKTGDTATIVSLSTYRQLISLVRLQHEAIKNAKLIIVSWGQPEDAWLQDEALFAYEAFEKGEMK